MNSKLVKTSSAITQQPSVASMMQAIIDKGVTADNVKALEALVGLKERCDEREAKRSFAESFITLQAKMPQVKAHKVVNNNDGTVRYKFAPLEDIMEQVQPMLQESGFAVSFSIESEDDKRMVMLCTLLHVGGHSETKRFAVRVGKGVHGGNECQSDGNASSYAKRYALCNALNITIDKDNDARAEGNLETISPDKSKAFQSRCIKLGVDQAKFLAFAKAESFEKIQASRFVELDAILKKKGG